MQLYIVRRVSLSTGLIGLHGCMNDHVLARDRQDKKALHQLVISRFHAENIEKPASRTPRLGSTSSALDRQFENGSGVGLCER